MIHMVVHIGEDMKAILNVREVKCKECLLMLTSLVLQIKRILKGYTIEDIDKRISPTVSSIIQYRQAGPCLVNFR